MRLKAALAINLPPRYNLAATHTVSPLVTALRTLHLENQHLEANRILVTLVSLVRLSPPGFSKI